MERVQRHLQEEFLTPVIPELRVEGANQLAAVQRALKNASPHVRRELSRGIREATEPVAREALDNIEPTLPSGGGLAAAVHADTTVVAQRRGGRASPGIRLRAKSARDVRRMDRGRLRHPLFGNKDHWFTQNIPPGWFTTPVLRSAPHLRKVLLKHIEKVGDMIVRSSR